jgi:hypothetical protein
MIVKAKNKLISRVIQSNYFRKEIIKYSEILIKNEKIKEDLKFFKGLKNKHLDKPAFVIGNGPSLKIEDLNRLVGQLTIASNKIYLAFGRTKWTPTYFTVIDNLLWPKIKNLIPSEISEVLIPEYLDYKECTKPTRLFKHNKGCLDLIGAQSAIENYDMDGFFAGYTVTIENIQLAMLLGANPIYLLGLDHNYKEETNVKEGVPIVNKSDSNHFIEGYRSVGEVVNPAPLKQMSESYEILNEVAVKKGFKIINISRESKLTAFERGDIEKVFDKYGL